MESCPAGSTWLRPGRRQTHAGAIFGIAPVKCYTAAAAANFRPDLTDLTGRVT